MALHERLADAQAWLEAHPGAVRVIGIALIWLATLVFIRYNARFFRAIDDRLGAMSMTRRTHYHLDRLLDAFSVIVALFLTLAVAGVSGALWGALTALGVAGIIIGFAAKDLVANIFAGIVILFERPFMPGDSIAVGSESGTVEQVSLRSTTLKQFNGLQITLPNSTFITKAVTNYTVNPTRRVEARVAILHDSHAPRAIELLREIAGSFEARVPDTGVDVFIVEVREYALVLELRFWVPRAELKAAQTHAYIAITQQFPQEGIELAVPMRRTVTVRGGATGIEEEAVVGPEDTAESAPDAAP